MIGLLFVLPRNSLEFRQHHKLSMLSNSADVHTTDVFLYLPLSAIEFIKTNKKNQETAAQFSAYIADYFQYMEMSTS
jgi:hypothetical protein